jgi:thiamine biosynthesis protein ThiI
VRSSLIVHYHEISLKRGNRPLFLRHLLQNLERTTRDLGPVRVRQLSGRILLDLEGNDRVEEVAARVSRVCGVASAALAWRVPSSVEAMKTAVAAVVDGRGFPSFRISARRAFKTYPLTSVELNRELGAFVVERTGARVDLRAPALEIHVEVLPAETFVYADRVPGPGGLPVGTAGTVAALLSGGIDSPVAAWRMIKRGCRVVFVHFHSVPYLPATSQAKARALVERLTEWQYRSQLLLVPLGEIQREVVLSVPPPLRVVVYRRMMVRIAETLGRQTGALALTTGESLGQVASQTLTNIARIDEAATVPILRPLIGMDKLEITAEAQRLGTFEISIEPDADCCTLFVPRHPSTRVSEDEIRAAESRLDIARLIAMGTDGAKLETFDFPPSFRAPALPAQPILGGGSEERASGERRASEGGQSPSPRRHDM